jgi:hypothetical protein
MPVNQVTIPQQGTANYAPGSDGTKAPYQSGSTLVPNPSKADGTGVGTGSNLNIIKNVPPDPAYVPNPAKADGIGLGTGTGATFLPESTQVPSPQKADGSVGIGSNLNFTPSRSNTSITYVPNPTKADGTDGGSSTPSGPVPGAPSALDFDPSTRSDQVTLNWTNGSPAGTTNDIWKSEDGGSSYFFYGSVAGNVTTFTDGSEMLFGAIWHYKIRATNSNGSSAFSNSIGCSNRYTSGNVASINFPTLLLEFDTFTATSLAALTSVSLPLLRTVGGNLNLSNNSSLATVNLNSLTGTLFSLFLGGSQPTTLSFPELTVVGTGNIGDFQIQDNTQCTSLSCPKLVSVAQNFTMYNMTALTSVSLPLLSGVGEDGLAGRLDFSLNTHLTSISFPSLISVWQEIDFGGCTLLTSVQMPVLDQITSPNNIYAISGASCPALVTWNAPLLNFIPDGGFSIDFTFDALSAASVNQVLHSCALANLGAGTNVNLNQGTNAAPTGQGITDKNTLIANGATVVTN